MTQGGWVLSLSSQISLRSENQTPKKLLLPYGWQGVHLHSSLFLSLPDIAMTNSKWWTTAEWNEYDTEWSSLGTISTCWNIYLTSYSPAVACYILCNVEFMRTALLELGDLRLGILNRVMVLNCNLNHN